MKDTGMRLKILLPFRLFAEHDGVLRIVAETAQGFFGILPHRLDGAAALTPGILVFEDAGGSERFLAVDGGVLVKTGRDVMVSVRHAVAGDDLHRLRETVEREFVKLDERERSVRSVLAKLETSFVRRMMELRHE
ncbi:F0F1 ATP synthase subunit epsilon [Verrucomicrobiota bacterium sgz303538]